MKKVLILAYDFPPYVSVGGLRPYSWYKYFHEFGLYPVVVTRQWGNKYGNHLDYIAPGESNETIVEENETGCIIRTAYKPNLSNRLLLKYGEKRFRLFRKAITAYYEFMQFLFFIGSKAGLYRGAKQYLKQHKVDAIIATGEPFVLFKYCSKLSSRYKIPWIADYRDLWSQNGNRNKNKLMQLVSSIVEKYYINNASAITTVSMLLKENIHKIKNHKKIYLIPNGYDSELSYKLSDKNVKNKKLQISFAGSIYDWHPWQNFLNVINELYKNDIIKVTIYLYGINKVQLVKDFCNNHTKEIINEISFIPKLPNDKLFFELAKTDLLLLFNDYSIMGTKIYNYIAAKRQILFCYKNDSEALNLKKTYFPIKKDDIHNQQLQEDLINETNSGIIINNSNHLQKVLQKLYLEHKEKGFIDCNSVGIEKYSRKHQTEKLAEIIKNSILQLNYSKANQ
jgi:glycosyltransferase involved in cell wall biosynthesis